MKSAFNLCEGGFGTVYAATRLDGLQVSICITMFIKLIIFCLFLYIIIIIIIIILFSLLPLQALLVYHIAY